MKKNLSEILFLIFRKPKTILFDIVALIVATLFWIFSPDNSIQLKFVVSVFIFLCIIIFTLVQLSMLLYAGFVPKMIYAKRTQNYDSDNTIICLLESSDLFSHDSIVAFYHVEHAGFEQLVGVGYVTNIQNDGRIQVLLSKPTEGYEDILTRLSNNDKDVLERMIVKPNISKLILDF